VGRLRRILIIEDERSVRWSLRRSLVAEGFDVREAATGREAARVMARGGPFDAIVLDSALPEARAIDVLAEIQDVAPRMPVILLRMLSVDECHGEPSSNTGGRCKRRPRRVRCGYPRRLPRTRPQR
jgi:CheY-like chemotaxis protein